MKTYNKKGFTIRKILLAFGIICFIPWSLFAQEPIPLTCGETVTGSTDSLSTGFYDHYSCAPTGWHNDPWEDFYSITVSFPTTIYVTLTPSGTEADFNLFILEDPYTPGDCIEWGHSLSYPSLAPFTLMVNLIPSTAGPETFYIVVDGCRSNGYEGYGSYTLELQCDSCITCEPPCSEPWVSLHTGDPVPADSLDIYWKLVSAPPGYMQGPTVEAEIVDWHGIGWSPPMPNSNWISHRNSGSPQAYFSPFTFERKFTFDFDSCAHPLLKVCGLVDDIAVINLNGNLIGNFTSQQIARSCAVINPSFFLNGVNTLSVEVINSPQYFMGLNLKGWICCGNELPSIDCGDTIKGSTEIGSNTITNYHLSGSLTDVNFGPEAIYTFTVPSSTHAIISLDPTYPYLYNPKIYLLDHLPTFTAPEPPGIILDDGAPGVPIGPVYVMAGTTYYIIIDAPGNFDQGEYGLIVNCMDIPLCQDSCDMPVMTFHSGMGLIPPGDDPIWSIIEAPPGITVSVPAKAVDYSSLSLIHPFLGSNWIAPEDPPSYTAGTYTYETTFTIEAPCSQGLLPILKMCILACQGTVYLNGHEIGYSPSQEEPTAISTIDYFNIPGMNSLTVSLDNGINTFPVMDVKAWICCTDSIPFPQVGCDTIIQGTNEDHPWGNSIGDYVCFPPVTNDGPEAIYMFMNSDLPSGTSFRLNAALDPGTLSFFRVYILDDLTTSWPGPPPVTLMAEILGVGNTTTPASAILDAGTPYYIVVDSPLSSDFGWFVLHLTCENYSDCEPDTLVDPITCFSTGENIAFGNDDPKWKICMGIQAKATPWWLLGWSPPMTGTNWVSYETPPTSMGGTYMFIHTFSIDTNTCRNPYLKLCILGDSVEVKLNSSLLGFGNSFETPVVLNASTPDFIQGLNTLSAELFCVPDSYPGINIKGWVYCEENLGVNDIPQEKSVRIFPNPAHNRITIKGKTELKELIIHNFVGKKIQQAPLSGKTSTVSTEHLANGIYLFTVISKTTIESGKIIIQH